MATYSTKPKKLATKKNSMASIWSLLVFALVCLLVAFIFDPAVTSSSVESAASKLGALTTGSIRALYERVQAVELQTSRAITIIILLASFNLLSFDVILNKFIVLQL